MIRKVRNYIFLKDVAVLSVTTFGGPQAHLAYFQRHLVERRAYLSSEDLLEVNSLCQMLPGPTSTQTLVAIGHKIGGATLAYFTLFVWILPACLLMILAGIFMALYQEQNLSLEFTRYIQPMAVGFVSYGAWILARKSVSTKTGIFLMLVAALLSYLVRTPYVFPAIIFASGLLAALKYKKLPESGDRRLVIPWSNFLLWIGVLLFAALLGGLTRWVPILLFENFYRNGSLVFGGGQVLTPMLYTEFVQYAPKQYLSGKEFLTGYAFAQSLPGPVFSFASYVGSLAMRTSGPGGQLLGGLMATLGIFLPGTFLIFFVIRFWESLKKYRGVRASLEGITAASSGLVITSAIVMFEPLEHSVMNIGVAMSTAGLLLFTKVPPPVIIIGGLLLGIVVARLRSGQL